MNELNEQLEAILVECWETIDAGVDIETCLVRYPEHADALRPYLELRTQMLALERPEPPAAAFATGRAALLERVAVSRAPRRWSWAHAVGAVWSRLDSPLARVAAVGALLFLLGGGALGASAAGGFQPARDVLSALPVVDLSPAGEHAAEVNLPSGGDQADESTKGAGVSLPSDSGELPLPPQDGDEQRSPNADDGATNAGEGIDNASEDAETGRGQADEQTSEVNGPAAPGEAPGLSLCVAEQDFPQLPDLPEGAVTHVPDVGACVQVEFLQDLSDAATCVLIAVLEPLLALIGHLPERVPFCDAETATDVPVGGPVAQP